MSNPGNGSTLLCVDDEATGLSVRKMVLESEGYRVLTAENGPDALALFARESIDLVVLDYSLPGMNGSAVAEKIRTAKPSIPILMLSAYLDFPSDMLALVDRSVTKGEPTRVLLAAIADLLSESRANQTQSAA